jgi:hypothetical protein
MGSDLEWKTRSGTGVEVLFLDHCINRCPEVMEYDVWESGWRGVFLVLDVTWYDTFFGTWLDIQGRHS